MFGISKRVTRGISALAGAATSIEAKDYSVRVPITTRETDRERLHFRLPESLRNGSLSQAFQLTFSKERSRFMLCGNPAMVQDTFKALLDQGFAMHRNKIPGQIMMENGF